MNYFFGENPRESNRRKPVIAQIPWFIIKRKQGLETEHGGITKKRKTNDLTNSKAQS